VGELFPVQLFGHQAPRLGSRTRPSRG
jgi:hypothetical protein